MRITSKPSVALLAREARERRIRLTGSVTLYASSLGVAMVLISTLARTHRLLEPQHLSFAPALFFSLAGVFAAAIIIWPIVNLMAERTEQSRSILIWLVIGLVFGFALPFLTGLLLPISGVFVDLTRGVFGAAELPSRLASAILKAPLNAFVSGTLSVFTGLLAGALLGPGAWIIDSLNASANPSVSRYATWGVAIVLALAIIAFVTLGSPEFLARLG